MQALSPRCGVWWRDPPQVCSKRLCGGVGPVRMGQTYTQAVTVTLTEPMRPCSALSLLVRPHSPGTVRGPAPHALRRMKFACVVCSGDFLVSAASDTYAAYSADACV